MIAQNLAKPLKNIYWNYYLISVCWNVLSKWAFCWRYPKICWGIHWPWRISHQDTLTTHYTIRSNLKFCFIPFHKYRVMDCYDNIGWEWCVYITHHSFGSSKPIIHNKILKRKKNLIFVNVLDKYLTLKSSFTPNHWLPHKNLKQNRSHKKLRQIRPIILNWSNTMDKTI